MFNKKFNLLKEATEYGFMPYMETYILDGKKRPIVVIFPGGGYGMVSEREAERIAMAYNAAGFHAAVVYYCVEPHTHPLPIQNAANAVAMLRENAEKWNIDTDKVIVCGFSACLLYTSIPIDNAYAIGDSMNDLPMLTAVPNSIVMGNGSEELKKSASFVTKDLLDNGIEYALKHFGMI